MIDRQFLRLAVTASLNRLRAAGGGRTATCAERQSAFGLGDDVESIGRRVAAAGKVPPIQLSLSTSRLGGSGRLPSPYATPITPSTTRSLPRNGLPAGDRIHRMLSDWFALIDATSNVLRYRHRRTVQQKPAPTVRSRPLTTCRKPIWPLELHVTLMFTSIGWPSRCVEVNSHWRTAAAAASARTGSALPTTSTLDTRPFASMSAFRLTSPPSDPGG